MDGGGSKPRMKILLNLIKTVVMVGADCTI